MSSLTIDDLPTWMRPRRRGLDPGLCIMLAFAVILVLPLALLPGLPRATDAELIELRAAQVAALARDGILYSRWAPGLSYGYGAPIFNFLAPLPHYLSGFHQVLTEVEPVDSVKLLLILSVIGAGCGMYWFVRGRYGPMYGVFSGLVYLISGPIALTLPYLRGDLPSLMSLALLPWCAWSFDQVWTRPGRASFALALIFFAAFLLTELHLAVFGLGILGIIAVTGHRLPGRVSRSGVYLAAIIALAIGLTAFYWLPALIELSDVRWVPTSRNPYAGSLPVGELLDRVPELDPVMQNLPTYRGIGLVILVAAILGVVGFALKRRRADIPLLFAAGALLIVGALPPFKAIWPDSTLLLAFYPYQAVLIGTFCLAVAAAGVAAWLESLPAALGSGWKSLAFVLLCAGLLFVAWPALARPSWPARGSETSPPESILRELRGEQFGSLRDGLLLPVSQKDPPEPSDQSLESLRRGLPDPLDRQSIPDGYQFTEVERHSLNTRYQIQRLVAQARPYAIRLFILSFQGWEISVDGQPLARGMTPEGFITALVPGDGNELTIRYTSVPGRDISSILSILCVIAFLALLRRRVPFAGQETPRAGSVLTRSAIIGLSALVFAYGLLAMLLYLIGSGARAAPADLVALPRSSANGVDFLGYALPDHEAEAGDQISVTAFWQAARPLTESYQTEARLINPADQSVVAAGRNRNPGGIPSQNWMAGRYIRDTLTVPLPSTLPPGDYRLQIVIAPCPKPGMLPCPTVEGLDFTDPAGRTETGAITIPDLVRIR